MRTIVALTFVAAAAAGTSTGTVKPRKVIKMGPRFIFGAGAGGRLSGGKTALCPSGDKQYCIDTRFSDETTCLYPDPTTIKICLDEGCFNMPENEKIFAKYGEDSYCKDYMTTPEGRLCHWSMTPCTCDKYDLEYVDARVIYSSDPIPTGWQEVKACEYPDNFKAENRRQNNDDQGGKRRPVPKFNNQGAGSGNSADLSIITNPTVIVSLILVSSLLSITN